MAWAVVFSVSAVAWVFIVLRLAGTIDWPWQWVLAPIWIPAAAFFVVLIVVGFWPRKRA